MYKDEIYYVFLEEHEDENTINKFVIRIFKNSNWHIESVQGPVPYDLENERFDREDVIDDILEQLRNTYDYVLEINYSDIDDYMEEE